MSLPHFELVQPDLFAGSGGQPNCWADFDNDGDLDLFVGYKADLPNRLYRYDDGKFKGRLKSTGLRPKFLDRLAERGVHVEAELFALETKGAN